MNMCPNFHLSPRLCLHCTTLVLILSFCLPSPGSAADFDRLSHFKSCDEFVSALQALQPQKQPNVYSRSLSIEEFGENRDALIVPEKVESVTEVWRSDDYALIFATAQPKTEASKSAVAAIIVLEHTEEGWSFVSLRRYETTGKYSGITCELTSGIYKEYTPGNGISPATLTFHRFSGGRGASESASWSLLFNDGELYEYR
jgi:hypothetical protein